jgi:UDP-N-acetylglucosamine 4,6-dehydratase/5-epimerase
MKKHPLDGAVVFISGGTGAWGRELTTQLLARDDIKEVRVYSRGEHPQVLMRRHFQDPRMRFIIGDVRDKDILGLAMKGADVVFHLAALKHVPICEENSWEAVLTNIYGTQNVIECAIENGVELVVDASTDKAVDPFNLYGVTKACGEKLIINANENYRSDTTFVCVRGGNVLGTTGSVIPLFKKQIAENNKITVTDPEMTRFLMSTRDAIGLLLRGVDMAVGGELFVMRMPATTLDTLAKTMIKLLGNEDTQIEVIGRRPGEKKHEALVSHNEAQFAKDIGQGYYVLLPQFGGAPCAAAYVDAADFCLGEYTSENTERLDEAALTAMLEKEAWLFDSHATGPLTL